MGDKYTIPATLRDIVCTWGHETHVERLLAWHGSDEAFLAYLRAVFAPEDIRAVYLEWEDTDIWDIEDFDLIADRTQALSFPLDYGLPAGFPDVADWARFMLPRMVQMPRGSYEERTHFRSSDDAKAAAMSGIPLSYFVALQPPLGEYIPLNAVLSAYRDGLAPEYARPLLYPSLAR